MFAVFNRNAVDVDKKLTDDNSRRFRRTLFYDLRHYHTAFDPGRRKLVFLEIDSY